MSAYIVNPEHICALVYWAARVHMPYRSCTYYSHAGKRRPIEASAVRELPGYADADAWHLRED